MEEELSASKFSFKQIKEEPKVLKFYTGTDLEAIEFILNKIQSDLPADTLQLKLSTFMVLHLAESREPCQLKIINEVLLTLCKLRHDFPEEDLASRFVFIRQLSLVFSHQCWR